MKAMIYTKRMLIAIGITLVSMQVVAQVGPPPPPPPQDPGEVPVDGGLVFLLAAGVSYGAKKAYDFRKGVKKTRDEQE